VTVKKQYLLTAVVMVMAMTASVAVAGMVDIGLGTMDQAEFQVLQQMVNGSYQPSASPSTPVVEKHYVAEFDQRNVEAIRQAMTATPGEMTDSVATNTMVDIGLGTMTTGEFCDLNKLVATNQATPSTGFTYICP
jgi:hypothetical protein